MIAPKTILICLVLFFTSIIFGLTWNNQPSIKKASAPADVFSAERAFVHVEKLASVSRAMGTDGHSQAVDYLTSTLEEMGLQPEVQTAEFLENDYSHRLMGWVQNILVRVPGRDPSASSPILIAAHYDTEFNTTGAGDNAAAVAAMLESIRALQAGNTSKHDLIFMFTDGEEMAQIGAQAFVEAHPWSRDVGLVLNFDGRGNSGQVFLFETSDDNANLLEALLASGAPVRGSSVSDDVYRLMGNTTDFGHLLQISEAQGLNFAHIGGAVNYHNQGDRPKALSLSTLQHQGELMLNAARHFGNQGVPDKASHSKVYFSLPILGLIYYSMELNVPLTILVAILFIAALVVGLRNKTVRPFALVGGFFWFLLSGVTAAILSIIVWQIFGIQTETFSGHGHHDSLFLVVGLSLALMMTGSFFAFFRKRMTPQTVELAVALLVLALTVILTLFIPGGSYVFQFALLFYLIAFLIANFRKDTPSDRAAIIMAVGALPGTLLITIIMSWIFQAFPLDRLLLFVFVSVLMCGLWLGIYLMASQTHRWRFPLTALLVMVITGVTVKVLNSSPDAEQPHFTSLIYAQDADEEQSYWLSTVGLDDWNSQYIKGDVDVLEQPLFFPNSSSRHHTAEAPDVALDAPTLEVLEEDEDDLQKIRIVRIKSPRGGHLKIAANEGLEFYSASINDLFLGTTFRSVRVLGIPEEGIEMVLAYDKDKELTLRVMNWQEGLPPSLVKSSPAHIPTTDFVMYQFSTMVTKSFQL